MQSETSLYKGTKIIWYVFYAIETLLLFRFVLKLLGANPAAGFTSFIYTLSGILLTPFRFVFETNQVGGSLFEWSTLLAMLVYWVVAWGIVKLMLMQRPVAYTEAQRKLEHQDTV